MTKPTPLEKRVANLELLVHALIAVIHEALPQEHADNALRVAREHYESAISLGGLAVPFFQDNDDQ